MFFNVKSVKQEACYVCIGCLYMCTLCGKIVWRLKWWHCVTAHALYCPLVWRRSFCDIHTLVHVAYNPLNHSDTQHKPTSNKNKQIEIYEMNRCVGVSHTDIKSQEKEEGKNTLKINYWIYFTGFFLIQPFYGCWK